MANRAAILDGAAKVVQFTAMTKKVLPLLVLVFAQSAAVAARAWPGDGAGRAAAGAALDRFETDLDAADSATQVLTRWCADHRLAAPPVIVALRASGVEKPADETVRRLLAAGPGEPVRYRRVALACGAHVLSEADNWYRPGLLTPEMNRQLDSSETPFGVVVRPLNFHRRGLGVEWLFRPPVDAPPGGGTLTLPHALLRHRALLLTAQGTPFSLVVETYTSEILAFTPPDRQ